MQKSFPNFQISKYRARYRHYCLPSLGNMLGRSGWHLRPTPSALVARFLSARTCAYITFEKERTVTSDGGSRRQKRRWAARPAAAVAIPEWPARLGTVRGCRTDGEREHCERQKREWSKNVNTVGRVVWSTVISAQALVGHRTARASSVPRGPGVRTCVT